MISFYTFFNSRPEWDCENVYMTGVLAVIKKSDTTAGSLDKSAAYIHPPYGQTSSGVYTPPLYTGVKKMKLQKFLDWADNNPNCSRDEWVKAFKKLGWTESSKFCTWHHNNQGHPTSKKFAHILNTPSITHGQCTEW